MSGGSVASQLRALINLVNSRLKRGKSSPGSMPIDLKRIEQNFEKVHEAHEQVAECEFYVEGLDGKLSQGAQGP